MTSHTVTLDLSVTVLTTILSYQLKCSCFECLSWFKLSPTNLISKKKGVLLLHCPVTLDLLWLWQFQATYGKPLVSARDPKCSAKDAEAGALAMEALHKQVSYFYDTFIIVFCSITVLKTNCMFWCLLWYWRCFEHIFCMLHNPSRGGNRLVFFHTGSFLEPEIGHSPSQPSYISHSSPELGSGSLGTNSPLFTILAYVCQPHDSS